MDSNRLRAAGRLPPPLPPPQTQTLNTRTQSLKAPTVPPVPSSTAMFPAMDSSQRAGSSRKKVALAQGCSPLDWARLNSSGANMRGIDPRDYPMRVSRDLLKKHATQQDCWTVLKGRVYNISHYVRFHPGGVNEIMKCAGRDGTMLFMKYHAWVNYESMLANCLVGMYVG